MKICFTACKLSNVMKEPIYVEFMSHDVVVKIKNIFRLVWWKLFVYPLALLLFYPVVPLLLTVAYLITDNERTLEKAVMSKYFTAFLDHGPQFVLRLVIVVLVGIAQSGVYNR